MEGISGSRSKYWSQCCRVYIYALAHDHGLNRVILLKNIAYDNKSSLLIVKCLNMHRKRDIYYLYKK
jgi:hypothetical protein